MKANRFFLLIVCITLTFLPAVPSFAQEPDQKYKIYIPVAVKKSITPAQPGWQNFSSPTMNHLNAVDLLSSGFGWAVGDQGTLLNWNGTQWDPMSSPTADHLKDVSIVSTTDSWAVGDGGVILHYDGTMWSSVNSPVSTTIYAVEMLAADQGWAVGEAGVILRWDGNVWSQVSSPTSLDLKDIDLIDSSDGWAVGGSWNNATTWYESIILHWNGSGWSIDPGIGIQPDVLEAVDFISATEGWTVAGNNGRYFRSGSNWQSPSDSGFMSWYYDVAMVSTNDVWAVGWNYANSNIVHWDGSTLDYASSPTPTGVRLNGISMLSASEGWAVGADGTIIRYSP